MKKKYHDKNINNLRNKKIRELKRNKKGTPKKYENSRVKKILD